VGQGGDRSTLTLMLLLLLLLLRDTASHSNAISSFGVAKVNFLSERTLSCIDSDNAREETRRWRS
jgi:hypothetical protein